MSAASRRLLPAALRRIVAGSAGLGVLLAPIPAMAAADAVPAHQVAEALPAPVWPGAGGAHARVSRPDPPQAPQAPPAAEHGIRVRPGDSLWLITAHRLGPNAEPADIARTWPQWYAANREVIGADPNLILPGQLLSPPAGQPASGAQR